jgi:hypothetical protein
VQSFGNPQPVNVVTSITAKCVGDRLIVDAKTALPAHPDLMIWCCNPNDISVLTKKGFAVAISKPSWFFPCDGGKYERNNALFEDELLIEHHWNIARPICPSGVCNYALIDIADDNQINWGTMWHPCPPCQGGTFTCDTFVGLYGLCPSSPIWSSSCEAGVDSVYIDTLGAHAIGPGTLTTAWTAQVQDITFWPFIATSTVRAQLTDGGGGIVAIGSSVVLHNTLGSGTVSVSYTETLMSGDHVVRYPGVCCTPARIGIATGSLTVTLVPPPDPMTP